MHNPVVIIGAGQVGEAAARVLLQEGLAPDALTLTVQHPASIARLESLPVSTVAVDLGDLAGLRTILEQARAILFSAAPGRGGSGREVYVEGLGHVLEALGDRTDLHFVYTSSTGVYAEDAGAWVDEDATLARGVSDRADTLIEAEEQLLDRFDRLGGRLTILRLSGLVGKSRGPHRRLESMQGTVRSDGDGWLNLVGVDDVARVIHRVFEAECTGVYNVSAPEPLLRREFYDAVIRRAGLRPVVWAEGDEGIGRGRRVDASRLVDVVGIAPRAIDPSELLP